MLYFRLSSPQVAIERVAKRVSMGGHGIPVDVINRRYYRGVKNLIELYIPACDNWMVNNNIGVSETIAQGSKELGEVIINTEIWNTIITQSNDY